MEIVTVSIELTDAQMEALKLISKAEKQGIEEIITCMTYQHIPALLDVTEVEDERRKRELAEALMEEENYSFNSR